MARLYEFYKDKVTKDMMARFGYKSVMEVPRIEKITLKPDGKPSGTAPLDVE